MQIHLEVLVLGFLVNVTVELGLLVRPCQAAYSSLLLRMGRVLRRSG
jgi:hypothetical protein